MKSRTTSRSLPVELGARLDHLLAVCWLPTQWATRIYEESELPPNLERSVRRLRADHAWRAYIEDSEIFCAIGRTGAVSSENSATAMLEVFFLDCEATVYAAGVWRYDCERGWKVHDVPEVSLQTARRCILPLLES